MKRFNVNGTCYPDQHYMVDITERLEQIRLMIQRGEYFCINRGRQYGKTTTLAMIKQYFQSEYLVFSLSFEGLGEKDCQSIETFLASFVRLLKRRVRYSKENLLDQTNEIVMHYAEQEEISTIDFKNFVSEICESSDRPIILLIDEVDHAGNYSAFNTFLGILREMYLERRDLPCFQSVILASVYDIKNLKLKIRPEHQHQYNSPWNIAADFNVDMSFSASAIETMLKEYEQEHQSGMDISQIATLLYDYTSGYPYLVCRLCKIMDEVLTDPTRYPEFSGEQSAWSKAGLLEAVKLLLQESNTLFDDMNKKIQEYHNLRIMLYDILYVGKTVMYHQYEQSINIAMMFGFIKNEDGKIVIANRIFEMWLYNLFVSEEQMKSQIYVEGSKDKNQFVSNGILDMKKVLEKFVEHFTDIYGDRDEKFIEEEGRKYFLFYLKPIINGTGNYYIEARTRDERRTDVIIDYLGKQYIVELKIWHGNAYNERGEQQLLDYLNAYHADVGYMLSFNFNQNKEVGIKEITLDHKTIIEAMV